MSSSITVSPRILAQERVRSRELVHELQEAATLLRNFDGGHPYLAKIEAAAARAHPNPSPAQQEAGNYRLGHVHIHGLDISIEKPRGSTRTGTDKSGKAWSKVMTAHYGYIKGSIGADSEHQDVYLGPDPDSELVFVIDQKHQDGSFDEVKSMLGFKSEAEAKKTYLAHVPEWCLGKVTPVPMAEYKKWVYGPNAHKPFARAKAAEDYRFEGDVQGVHLRATLHKLLDAAGLPGMAYNDARTGQVHANIGGSFTAREKVLAALRGYEKQHHDAFRVQPEQRQETMHDVALTEKDLREMMKRQGMSQEGTLDPTHLLSHFAERFRLHNDKGTLTGKVPELAYKQLQGLEPMYHVQLERPELFSGKKWDTPASPPAGLPVLKAATQLRRSQVRIKLAGHGSPSLGLDLDGTILEGGQFKDKDHYEPVRAGAIAGIKKLQGLGVRVIINTCRGDQAGVKKKLQELGVPFDAIGENKDAPPGINPGKLFASLYADDLTVDGRLPWPKIVQEVTERLKLPWAKPLDTK